MRFEGGWGWGRKGCIGESRLDWQGQRRGVGVVGGVGRAEGMAAGWTMCYVRAGWRLLSLSPYQSNNSPSVAPFPLPSSCTT